jgi:hypothetical protein
MADKIGGITLQLLQFYGSSNTGGSSILLGMPKGGLPLTTRRVLPLHRLLALLEQVLLSTQKVS